jgi:hypothetical protein
MKPRSWRPDWKDPNAYPNPNTSPLQWAWEFLRRNPRYEQQWKKLIQPGFKIADLNNVWKSAQRETPGHRYRPRLNSDPALLFEREFHVLTYPPPPWENKAKLRFAAQFVRYQRGALSSYEPTKVHGAIDHNQMVIWFNLGWPIDPQLTNAKLTLKLAAKEFKDRRLRFPQYQTYLRLLDARAAGAKEKQIIQILYREQSNSDENARQKMRDDVEPAERLRDEDFWLIAVLGVEM